jgi:hypothetical protein
MQDYTIQYQYRSENNVEREGIYNLQGVNEFDALDRFHCVHLNIEVIGIQETFNE